MFTPESGKKYDHTTIERKWQEEWRAKSLYKTAEDSDKPKHYILDMFPYPSGEGLHVGHPRGYVATDVYSRHKRMQGFNVLHPMGWDAFGLPAENFAIKNKVHPRVAVEKNVARFKEQLALIGPDYDWSREINTTDPAFYKWTQWIFLQMFKKGLAYESWEPINWCPSCQTGLANEDVDADGTCERCGTKVEQKPMRQWVLKITEYADRMLADLDKLPKWPDGVKEAQRHWIGKSEGAEIDFAVEGQETHPLTVFTTRPDTIYGATFIAVSAGLAKTWMDMGWKPSEDVERYIAATLKEQLVRDFKEKEKTGIAAGFTAKNPATDEQIPVWIANYVLSDVGTGAIMAVPSHDERDHDFATRFDLAIVNTELVDVQEVLEKVKGRVKKNYKIKDWVFSRQRYWGEPIPVVHCEKCGVVGVPESELPVMLPEVEFYAPTGTGESPLADISDWVNTACPSCKAAAKRETNTMPQWAGSSWYYLRYIDPKNDAALIDLTKEKEWMPVDVYVGGDHATRHLIYARFWHKFLFDIGVVTTEEPFPRLEFLGFILAADGKKFSKRDNNGISPTDVINQFGADAFRLYEMFIGPFESTAPWNNNGLVGTYRFVEKIWSLYTKGFVAVSPHHVHALLHKTIKKVTDDIESFKFNTAVSALMIFVNEAGKEGISENDFKTFLQVLAPFAPHVTEELWYMMGESQSIHLAPWPVYDPSKVVDDTVTIGVQINGKLRGDISVVIDAAKEDIEAQARALPKVQEYIADKQVLKVIVVPGRIINIVTAD